MGFGKFLQRQYSRLGAAGRSDRLGLCRHFGGGRRVGAGLDLSCLVLCSETLAFGLLRGADCWQFGLVFLGWAGLSKNICPTAPINFPK